MKITAFYAAMLVPIFLILALRVIRARRRAQVAVGDGGDDELLRRRGVQANFAEYVPFALLLMALAESQGLHPLILHAMGLALLAARASHAYGMSQSEEVLAFRSIGVAVTFAVLVAGAVSCVLLAV